ncbi:uncharacterized protein LOC110849579 [Folsomia candida]|uniref:Uncharacterized protein n=1 Tax=Folsomia candida TaxID=158441 RepID=A0A226E8K8_FOLCA|nr:uncharacterized protein LOC110849579 [Folsomia candida]OXA53394.1 hypothetical protein Fcan01_11618 [Folsomia candida]
MHRKAIVFFVFLLIDVHTGMGVQLSHSAALARLQGAGISLSSTGNCSNRNNRLCTSLENIRSETIDWLIHFKQTNNCPFVVTGGTETGHGRRTGVDSHWGGYKVDLRFNSCLNQFIERGSRTGQNSYFRYIGTSSYGPRYRSGSGAILLKESNHWDALWPANPVVNWGG